MGFGAVQVGGDVKPRHGLEVQVFDNEFLLLHDPGDGCLQIRSRGQRRQAEHLEELGPQQLTTGRPLLERGDIREAGTGETRRFRLKVVLKQLVSAARDKIRVSPEQGQAKQPKTSEKETELSNVL